MPRPLTLPRQVGLDPKALYIGNGQNAIEVIAVDATGQPSGGALQAAWKARRGGRASPVLLIALYGDHAALCGPAGDDPPRPRKTGIAGGLRPDRTLPRSSCLARCSSCCGAALPRRYVSRWGERGASMSSSHQRAATVTRHAITLVA
jgi:hypothetical protein